MKVVFVNRFFYPDHSATSQLLGELACDLVAAGVMVQVVTSRQRYDDARAGLASLECHDGVSIIRVWTSRFGRGHLLGRAIDYVTFYIAAGIALFRVVEMSDVVVAKTDPPLISVVAAVIAQIRGAVLVNWLQDVFPEVAERLGIMAAGGVPSILARSLRNYSIKRAELTIVLGDRMARVIKDETDVATSRLRVIHNWADGDAVRPLSDYSNDLRLEWGIRDQFVVSYSGNMGRAHEFKTLLEAIYELRHESNLLFLFIGEGHHAPWLRSEVECRGLSHLVQFRPYQPKDRLSQSLGIAHVHVVTLHPTLEGLIVPSKFYGIAAAGRGTIFVGDLKGEIAAILAANECGHSVSLGDVEALAWTIRALKNDPAGVRLLGHNAREAFMKYYDRRIAVKKWKSVLCEAELHWEASPRVG